MATADQIDAMLLQVAERSGGIAPLLNAFFGFLHRRTDFYVVHDAQPNTSSPSASRRGPGRASRERKNTGTKPASARASPS